MQRNNPISGPNNTGELQEKFMLDVYEELMAAAEEEVKNGKTLDADSSIKILRQKFNL